MKSICSHNQCNWYSMLHKRSAWNNNYKIYRFLPWCSEEESGIVALLWKPKAMVYNNLHQLKLSEEDTTKVNLTEHLWMQNHSFNRMQYITENPTSLNNWKVWWAISLIITDTDYGSIKMYYLLSFKLFGNAVWLQPRPTIKIPK